MIRLFALVAAILVIAMTMSCEEDEPSVVATTDIFNLPIGTKWVYANDVDTDTVVYEYLDTMMLNNEVVAQIAVTDASTKLYVQRGNQIYSYGEIDTNLGFIKDFQQPAIEFFFDTDIEFRWIKSLLVFGFRGTSLFRVEMEVVEKEIVTTPAGTFECDVIEDEFGVLFYVAPEGVVRRVFMDRVDDEIVTVTESLVEIR